MKSRAVMVVLITVLAAFGLGAPSASASSLVHGECVVNLTFDFDSPVKSTLTSPTYSLSGLGQCFTLLNTDLDPTTSVVGSGSSTVWSCGATLAGGTWDQSWDPAPSAIAGVHSITGTWGAWEIVVQAPGYLGVGEFTTRADQPSEALKVTKCATSGISKIKMTGVLSFQDP